MEHLQKNKFVREGIWLFGILVISAALEYAIITLFDFHPILSVKIQGFIGLVIIAYIIRMITRMGKEGLISFDDEEEDTPERWE